MKNFDLQGLQDKIETVPRLTLLSAVALTAFLALLPSWINYDVISRDGAFQFIPMAKMLLEGNFHEVFLNNSQMPLFPLLLAGVAKATGFSLELSGRIVSYISFVLAAVGMFKLGEVLFRDRSVALLGVLFFITNRQILNRSIDCLKEALLLCLIIWGSFMILKGISDRRMRFLNLAGGALLMLVGALNRSTAILFLLIWLFIWVFHEKKGWYYRSLFFIIPVGGVLGLWAVKPDMVVFQKTCYNISYFFLESHTPLEILKSAKDVLTDFFVTGSPGVMLFMFYGMYRSERTLYFYHACLTLVSFYLILIFWLFASSRYYLVPIAWVYPFAAFGITYAFRQGGKAVKVLAGLAVASCFVLWAHISLTPPDPDKLAWKDAGRWILAQAGSNREIVSNRDRLVFYAEGVWIPLESFKKEEGLTRPMAVDTDEGNGKTFDEGIRALGRKPDKQFRTINIYLPGVQQP